MPTQIFVNLPVKDLAKSIAFFQSLGFSSNPQFTDETAACIVVSGDIYVMLLTNAKFKEFTPKEVCDATNCTEVLVALSCEGRRPWTNSFERRLTPEAAPIAIRRIMASCTPMDSRIQMATSGKSSTWSQCRLAKPRNGPICRDSPLSLKGPPLCAMVVKRP
jgi:predicted lactoylglutathione lyase